MSLLTKASAKIKTTEQNHYAGRKPQYRNKTQKPREGMKSKIRIKIIRKKPEQNRRRRKRNLVCIHAGGKKGDIKATETDNVSSERNTGK